MYTIRYICILQLSDDNSYHQRKGTNNFFSSARIYNTNQTIEFLGANQLQTIDSTVINKYNTNSFVHIE